MARALTVGSLFSGIGGFDLGFERAGFEIRWQVEIDAYASAVLAQHWPTVRRYRDVREIHGPLAHTTGVCAGQANEQHAGADAARHQSPWAVSDGAACLEPVDVICGGFPCQPHSLAGKRAGAADERDLWPHFARLIRELQPRWVVAENVPGLLSSDAGRFFGSVLGDLAACGYDAEWDCLPAAAFGAPHRRDRVWIVAYPQSARGRDDSGAVSGADAAERRTGASIRESRAASAVMADALHDGRGERAVSEGQARQTVSDAARRGRSGADVADRERARLERLAGDGDDRHEPGRLDAAADGSVGAGGVSAAVADDPQHGRGARRARGSDPGGAGERERALHALADADAERWAGRPRIFGTGWGREFTDGGAIAPDPNSESAGWPPESWGQRGQWESEPAVGELVNGVSGGLVRFAGRVAHGVPNRVQKLKGLGNAIVPQIAQWIAERIKAAEGLD